MAQKLIELSRIAKFHGEKPVLANVNLDGCPGEFHLLLGANGAGKTTLLRIMAGLSAPERGKIAKHGRVAFLGHQTWLYPELTALENLKFQAKINGLSPTENAVMDILALAGLKPHAHERARVFSRGMAQRLNFCRLLLLDPQIYLLDEPFTGMDRASRELLTRELAIRTNRGACLFMVSHAPQEEGHNATHVHTLERGVLSSQPPCRD